MTSCSYCGTATGDEYDEHAECVDVAAAAAAVAASREELEAAIRRARASGQTLRAIAQASGLSPEWVRRIAAK